MTINLTEFVPLRVTFETRKELDEISLRWDVSRSAVIRKAIQDFIDNYIGENMAIAEQHAHNERLASNA